MAQAEVTWPSGWELGLHLVDVWGLYRQITIES